MVGLQVDDARHGHILPARQNSSVDPQADLGPQLHQLGGRETIRGCIGLGNVLGTKLAGLGHAPQLVKAIQAAFVGLGRVFPSPGAQFACPLPICAKGWSLSGCERLFEQRVVLAESPGQDQQFRQGTTGFCRHFAGHAVGLANDAVPRLAVVSRGADVTGTEGGRPAQGQVRAGRPSGIRMVRDKCFQIRRQPGGCGLFVGGARSPGRCDLRRTGRGGEYGVQFRFASRIRRPVRHRPDVPAFFATPSAGRGHAGGFTPGWADRFESRTIEETGSEEYRCNH